MDSSSIKILQTIEDFKELIQQDSTHIEGIIGIVDTVSVVDAGNYLSHPAFWVSVISIIIAIISIFLPPYKERRREINRLTNLKEYVYYLLSTLYSSYIPRSKIYRKIYQEVKNIDSRKLSYTSNLNHNAEILLNLSQDDLFKIFISEKKRSVQEDKTHFKVIIDAIEYYARHDKIGERNFEEFMSNLRRYESEYREHLDRILRFFDRIVSFSRAEEIPPSQDKFLRGIDIIIHTWQINDQNASYNITSEILLDPLKVHCKEFTYDPRAMEFLEHIIKCNYAILNIRALRSIYSSAFLEIAKSLKQKSSELEQSIVHFFPNFTTNED